MGKAIVVGIILLVIGLGGGYYFATNYKVIPTTAPAVPTPEIIPPRPYNGPTTTQMVTAAPTIDESALLVAAIKAGLVAEHGPQAANMTVSVSKITGDFAQGMANEQGGGGIWFAAKMNGSWKLVWDGNGIIQCSDLTNYPNFPKTMIPQCYDSATQNMITQ